MHPLVLHVDMDAFFAEVEIRSDPRLRGKPVAVGGGPGPRGVVTTASYDARRYGVRSGMPLFEALRLCPGLLLVPVDPRKYVHESLCILSILERFSPRVEAASIDEAYLAFPPQERELWKPAAEERGRAIREAVRRERGLPCSVGAGGNKLEAKMTTRLAKPDGLAVLEPGSFPRVFGASPVSLIPGIGPRTEDALGRIGIRTVGELAAGDPSRLAGIFGRWSAVLQEEAAGRDSRAVLAEGEAPDAKSASHETTFARDVRDPVELRAVVWALADRVGRRLRAEGFVAGTVAVRFKIGSRRRSCQRKLPDPTDDPRELARVAWDLLETSRGREPLRLVGVAAQALRRGDPAEWLFPEEQKRRELLLAADRLRDRYGEGTLLPAGVFREGGSRT